MRHLRVALKEDLFHFGIIQYKHIIKLVSAMLLMVLCAVLITTTLSQALHASIDSSSTLAGQTVSHFLTVTLTNYTLPANSYLYLNYTPAWTSSASNRANNGDFCQNICTLTAVTLTPSANKIRIDNFFPNPLTDSYTALGLSLNNIRNPIFALTDSITLDLFSNTNTLLATSTISMQINPSQMTCSATPTDTTVQATTPYSFTIAPSLNAPLPSSGSLDLYFPSSWINSLSGSTFSFSSCSNTGGPLPCSVTGTTITASSVVMVTGSAPFSFTLDSVISPGSSQTNSQLRMQYKMANGSVVGSCSVPITGLQSTSVGNVTFTIIANKGTLNFTSVLAPMTTDEVLITFPSEYYLGNVENIVQKINGIPPVGTVDSTKITGLNQLLLRPFSSNNINFYQIQISDISILYPTTTPFIDLQITRYGYPFSKVSCCSNTLAPAQTLTLTNTLTNNDMKGLSQYSFSFSTSYLQANYLLLDFCTQFTLTPAFSYPCYLTLQPNTPLTCTANNNSQLQLSLSNSAAFSTVMGHSSTQTIIVSGITNPSQSTCSLIASSYIAPANKLEFSPTLTLIYSPTLIVEAYLSLSDVTVGALSTYTFTVNNTNPLPLNSELHIYFPSTLIITGLTCTFDNLPATFSILNSTHLNIQIPTTITQYALPLHTFEVVSVTNPPSLRPSSTFILQLQHNGLVLQSLTEGLYANPTALSHFNSPPIITASTLITGQPASYTISFAHSLTIPNTSSIQLYFSLPPQFQLFNCSGCSDHNTFNITNTSSSVVISDVINPSTVIVNNKISISLLVDGYLSIEDYIPSPIFTAASLTYSVTSNSTYLGEAVSTNVSITALPLTTHTLLITVPNSYTINSPRVYSPHAQLTFTNTGHTFNLTLTLVMAPNVTVIIEGLTTPTTTPSSVWALSTSSSSGIPMASGTSTNLFIAPCGTTCKACVNSSYCLSCYSNSAVNSLPLLDYSSNTCLNSCGSTQFQQSLTCYSCSSNCLTCSMFSTNCTSCTSPSLLYNYTCLSVCPDSDYASSTACIACTIPCQACSSGSACLSCVSGYILLSNGSCTTSCPSSQYNSSNNCISCPLNCSTCTQTGCTACLTSNYLIMTPYTICLSVCPQGHYISANSSWCQPCQSPCLSCTANSTLCTSCNPLNSLKYLHNTQCLTICPNATYSDQLNQCQGCQFPCNQCSSATNCTTCQGGYYLYPALGQCTTICIANTIPINNICQQCLSPCLTCSTTTSNCNSCIPAFFLLSNNTCTDSCQTPNVPYQGICSPCLYPCLVCDATNTSKCSSCASGYLLYQLTCYTVCPTHTYLDSSTTCAFCTPPCSQCSLTPSNCTACYNHSSLLSNVCHNPCPVNYFSTNGTCITCQSQCSSCPYSAADQCLACSNSAYFHNPLTYHCTASCSDPYFATTSTPLQCIPCQLPCKTCTALYNQCASCYFGNYLLSNQCQSACPANHYEDSLNNWCVACPSRCSTCNTNQCLGCLSGNLFYGGSCYSTCPSQAPYPYLIYCRNCLLDHCILCNSQGTCTLCEIPYLLSPTGPCVSICPSDYQPDTLTSTRCVKKPDVAFAEYIRYLQGLKIWAMIGSLTLLLSLLVLPFAELKLLCLCFLLALPQTLSLVHFAVIYTFQQSNLIDSLLDLPAQLGLVLLVLHFVFSVLHVCLWWKNTLRMDQKYTRWLKQGSNSCRSRIVFTLALLNKQAIYFIFTGLHRLPITTLHFRNPNTTFYFTHVVYMGLEAALVAVGAFIVVAQKTQQYNYKLFYSAVDLITVFTISIVIDLTLLIKAEQQPAPTPYQKYILPHVSNQSLPALSQPPQPPQQPNNGLHRSSSDQDLFQSEQMKKVEYRSVFDPQDFYDDTPLIDNSQIKDSLLNGKFRKKEKKKRGQRRMKGGLAVIDQQEGQQQEQEKADKKKRRPRKSKPTGGLNNYIYYRKPVQKKTTPDKIFKQNQNTIMSRIRQKQSQFDTITQNDIVFQEELELNSSSDDGNWHNQSRRALQKPPRIDYYDTLFNLNYAEKYHMDGSEAD